MRGRTALPPRSLRGRLLIIVLSAVLATAVLVGGIGAQVLAGFLDSRLEARMQSITDRIASVARQSPARVADATSLRTLLPEDSLVILTSADGAPVSFGSADLDASAIAHAAEEIGDGDVLKVRVPSAGEGERSVAITRVDTDGLQIRLEDLPEPVATDSVIFAVDVTADRDALAALTWIEIGIAAVVVLVVGSIAIATINLGIRPLTLMARTADALTSGDRSRRLPRGHGGSEADRLAASVNRALDAQQEAEDRLRAFLDDVSHELRTPLTTVNGWIDLYLQGGLRDADARDRAMERMEGEVARMRTLVDELTLLSRLDAQRPHQTTAVRLDQLAREVVDDAGVLADGRELIIDAPDPVVVLGDENRLAQVLRNLVGNAMQHTPATAAVHVGVVQDNQRALVRVHDDGPGIAATDLPRVFDRFWRAEPSRSRSTGGSGLGLAIVAAIVTAHGGSVSVTSGAASGTTFTVSLPSAPTPTA